MAREERRYRRATALRWVYALCLAGASWNHWTATYRHGWLWDYGGYPRASTLFWTSLGVADPLVAVLLFVRPRIGVALTVAIIVVDVIHNLAVLHHYFPPLLRTLATVPSVGAQIAFMLFVLATCRVAGRVSAPRASRPTARRASPAGAPR